MVYLITFAFLIGMIWFSWVSPYRTWSDPRWFYIADAEMLYKKHRRDIWLPVYLSLALAFCALILVIEDWWVTGQVSLDDLAMRITIYLLLITGPISIPCFCVARHVDTQFRCVIASPHCIACGYDLRGNPDAATCSECGAEVLQVKVERDESVDNPGQDPAGHDRA
jgi:hypothetical protein